MLARIQEKLMQAVPWHTDTFFLYIPLGLCVQLIRNKELHSLGSRSPVAFSRHLTTPTLTIHQKPSMVQYGVVSPYLSQLSPRLICGRVAAQLICETEG